jgi:putative restriction endonuclease
MAEKKNWQYRAGVIWPVLVNAAKNKEKPQYLRDIAPLIETSAISVGLALGPIQTYCLENHLPPLTAIVVAKATGLPGDGFIAWDVDDIDSAQQAVFAFNWDAIPNPYGGFGEDDTIDSFAEEILRNPNKVEEIYTKVRVRGIVQKIFRKALLDAYNYECAFCGLSFEEALDAAHIIPWRDASSSQRLDPANGVLLCSTHHKLFDNDYLSIDESLKIQYLGEIDESNFSDMDKALTLNLIGRKIKLPSNKVLQPNKNFLKIRNGDGEL